MRKQVSNLLFQAFEAQVFGWHLIALLLACVQGAAIYSAEPVPQNDPILVPKDATLFGEVSSVPRLIERYRGSPYFKMLATAWGQDLGEKLRLKSPSQSEFWVMLQDLQRVGVVLLQPTKDQLADAGSIGVVLQERAGATQVLPWLEKEAHPEPTVIETTMTGPDGKVTKNRGEFPNPPQLAFAAKRPFYISVRPDKGECATLDGAVPKVMASDYCVEVNATPDSLAKFLPVALAEMVKGSSSQLKLGARLTPRGVEERAAVVLTGQELADWQKLRKPRLDVELFRGLPPATIWAVLWRLDPEFTPRALRLVVFPNTPEGMMLRPLDKLFTKFGLPTTCEMLGQVDGHLLAYMEAVGADMVFTIQVHMPPALGEKAKKFLASYLNLAQEEVGVLEGRLNGQRCQAAYLKGQFTLTTHPDGLKAVFERKPGFLEQKEIQDALRCVPDPAKNDLLLLQLGRSGEWWSRLIGGLMRKPGPASELEQTVTADLRKFLSFSYDYACLRSDGYEVRGEGLLGGPKLVTFASVMAVSLMVKKVRAPDGSERMVNGMQLIQSGDLFLLEEGAPDGQATPQP